jgi:hypothetical protein
MASEVTNERAVGLNGEIVLESRALASIFLFG